MYWRCDICDKIIYEELANYHLQSGYHKRLSDSFIRRYIITNPKPKEIDDTIGRYLRFHYRQNEKFLVIFSVKLLIPSNQIKNIRRQYPCHRNRGCIYNTFISKIRIFKEQLYSQILELRITFVTRFVNITFDHYITKPKSMLEWKLVAMFDKKILKVFIHLTIHIHGVTTLFFKNFMIFT